jgi:hypothetical protein
LVRKRSARGLTWNARVLRSTPTYLEYFNATSAGAPQGDAKDRVPLEWITAVEPWEDSGRGRIWRKGKTLGFVISFCRPGKPPERLVFASRSRESAAQWLATLCRAGSPTWRRYGDIRLLVSHAGVS